MFALATITGFNKNKVSETQKKSQWFQKIIKKLNNIDN
jgi:hypothetical protein